MKTALYPTSANSYIRKTIYQHIHDNQITVKEFARKNKLNETVFYAMLNGSIPLSNGVSQILNKYNPTIFPLNKLNKEVEKEREIRMGYRKQRNEQRGV